MKKIRCIIMTTMCVLVAWFWTSCTKDEVELTGEIYGKITNGQSGEPLNGVSVTITPGGKSTFTGNDGAFSFVGCEPGQYSLQAQKRDSRLIISRYPWWRVKPQWETWRCLLLSRW